MSSQAMASYIWKRDLVAKLAVSMSDNSEQPCQTPMCITSIDIFGDSAEIDHVGLAAQSIGAISPRGDKVVDPLQGVSVSFVDLHGITIELVEPIGEDSPVSNMMKRGCKLLHICFRVQDLDNAIQHARKRGVHVIAKPVPAIAFQNRKIAWLYSSTWGLLELVESPKS